MEMNRQNHLPEASSGGEQAGATMSRRKLLLAMGMTGAALASGTVASALGSDSEADCDCSHVIYLDSVADLALLNTTSLPDGQQVSLAAYHPTSGGTELPVGGGMFVWRPQASKSTHNGGTIISPTVPYTWHDDGVSYTTGAGESNPTGLGVYVRLKERPWEFTVDEFGAIGNSDNTGTGQLDPGNDDWASFQACANAGIATGRPFDFVMGMRAYKIGNEVSFTNATTSYNVRGESVEKTFVCPTPFGASKALFRCDSNEQGEQRVSSACRYEHFHIRRGTAHKNHPIGIYHPFMGRSSVENVTSGNLGNTVVWTTGVFNCDWSHLNLFSSGWQPLHRMLPDSVRASTTAGSSTVTVNQSVFQPSDVGKVFYIQQGSIDHATLPNSAMVAIIAGVVSSTEITLDRPALLTQTNRRVSFGIIRGSLASGSNQLTMEADAFDSDDVGRFLYIDGAGSSGGLLACRIVAVLSPAVCVLDTNAATAVTNGRVFWAPTIYAGRVGITGGGTPINDFVIDNLLVELFRGPAIIADGGTHMYLNQFKAHGQTFGLYTNFARSSHAIYNSGLTRFVVNGAEWEFGCHESDMGYVVLAGQRAEMLLDHITLNAPCYGAYSLADFRADDERSVLNVGNVMGSREYDKDLDVVNTRGSAILAARTIGSGQITGPTRASERGAALSSIINGVRACQPVYIPTNGVFRIKPRRSAGHLTMASHDTGLLAGLFYYRVGPSGAMTAIHAGASTDTSLAVLTGSTGASGRVTISAAPDGYIYLENRSSQGRTFTLSLLG